VPDLQKQCALHTCFAQGSVSSVDGATPTPSACPLVQPRISECRGETYGGCVSRCQLVSFLKRIVPVKEAMCDTCALSAGGHIIDLVSCTLVDVVAATLEMTVRRV
jgi:hypothetical protein